MAELKPSKSLAKTGAVSRLKLMLFATTICWNPAKWVLFAEFDTNLSVVRHISLLDNRLRGHTSVGHRLERRSRVWVKTNQQLQLGSWTFQRRYLSTQDPPGYGAWSWSLAKTRLDLQRLFLANSPGEQATDSRHETQEVSAISS